MKMDLVKKKPKRQDLKKPADINKGDFVLADNGEIFKVGKKIKKGFEILHQHKDGNWEYYGDAELDDFDWKYLKINKSAEELEKEVFDNIKDLKDPSKKEEISSSTDLVRYDKSYYLRLKENWEESRKKYEIMERVLNKKRYELQHIVGEFENKLEKCNKVLGSIELYMGIHEDIIQIQEGAKASQKTPLCFRQQVLFMDEEVGDPTSGGLDFKRIEEFDDWLTKDKNYLKMIPEEKGVVAVKIRREDKHYSENFWVNFLENQDNHRTFILIRNGENIYRIWADIHIYPRLFPKKSEMDKLFKAITEGEYYVSGEGHFEHISKEDAEDTLFDYGKNFLMLQGLLDRTPIFHPLPKQILLSKPETYGKWVQFIYDDEASLTEGKKYYRDWRNEINSKVKRGSRIYFKGFSYYQTSKDATSRFPFITFNKPPQGIYTVVRVEKGKYETKIVCHFNPKDTVYDSYWNSHERKKAIPFYLFYRDDCFLNYDLLSLDDVEYYIDSRIDRGNYLHMLPVLWGIRKKRHEELEWEKGFVANLKLRLPFDDKDKLEKQIWKAIEWWKHKVIWNRPITKDDAKALRMITSKVKRDLGILK